MTDKITIERETLKRLIAEAHHSGDSFADTEVIVLAEEALAAQPADPVALDNACMTEQAIDEYLSDYTMEGDSGSHTPDESELLVIKDAIMGLLVYPDFLASFAPPAPAAVPVAWMPIESSPKDGSWMYVWRKHGTFPIQAKYNIKYAWFEDDDANHLYNLTHWMPLPAAPGAAPPAPVPPDPAAEMDAVAIRYAHKMALDLECILVEYGGSWYNTAMQTLGEYRSAMNAIHERESPTFMGEPVTAAGDKP